MCGDRKYKRYSAILHELSKYDAATTLIIHGCAQGADTLAGVAAKKLGMRVAEYPADWRQYGKAAGPKRNKLMLDDGRPDLVLAFHDSIATSKGTANMLRQAEIAGVETRLIEYV